MLLGGGKKRKAVMAAAAAAAAGSAGAGAGGRYGHAGPLGGGAVSSVVFNATHGMELINPAALARAKAAAAAAAAGAGAPDYFSATGTYTQIRK
jgi:hypothetical protein